jgi:hypothetical protein
MKAIRLWPVLVTAALAAACGEGRAIFTVDVFSFLQSAQHDTLSYFAPLPLGTPDTIPEQKINVLPVGSGSSVVDSARLTGTVAFENSSGTGNLMFKLYIDTVPGVYARAALDSVAGAVSGTATTLSPFTFDVKGAALQFFTSTQVYVGIRVVATATSPPVRGKAHLTALVLRVVLQDKVF